MRPLAIVPALCCAVALILSFLCLFAGHKKDFMEDYHMITLNTSRIGYSLLNTSSSSDSSNPFTNLIDSWKSDINSELNDIAGDIASELGLADFYSLHILDYCYGSYTPSPLANASIPASSIHKNVSACTTGNQTTPPFHFDPEKIIQAKLNASGLGITLDDLNWPDDLSTALKALHAVETAMFALYIAAIALTFISLVAALPAILLGAGRLAPCINVLLSLLAFTASALASALVTAVIVKGASAINKYGDEVGLEAHRGGKFLALTWAATAVLAVGVVVWCVEVCCGGAGSTAGRKRARYAEKGGKGWM